MAGTYVSYNSEGTRGRLTRRTLGAHRPRDSYVSKEEMTGSSEQGSFLSVLTHLRLLPPSSPPVQSSLTAMSGVHDKVNSSLESQLGDSPASGTDLLLGSFDPSKLHPLAGIEDKLDYLLLDDDKTSDLPGAGTAIPSRGWSDDLCYGTGTMYLSGSYSLSAFNVRPPVHHPSPSKTWPSRSC